MSRHLVTACLFCLLCASHTTCNTHEVAPSGGSVAPQTLASRLTAENNFKSDRYYQKLQKIRGYNSIDRRKRHAEPQPTGYAEELFRLYGDPGSMTMNVTGFNRMLEGLNLNKWTQGGEHKTESKPYLYASERDAEQDAVVEVSWLNENCRRGRVVERSA